MWGGTKSNLVPPLFRRCGGTFPQGKVRNTPAGGRLPPRGRWQGEALTDEGDTLSQWTKPGLNRQGSPPHPALRGHPLQAGEGGGFGG